MAALCRCPHSPATIPLCQSNLVAIGLRPASCRHPQQHKSRRHHHRLLVGASAGDDQASSSNQNSDFTTAFSAELAARQAAEAAAAEKTAAASFDGQALLALLRQKYGRSYDVSLVQRTYMGKLFVALNIMWKYMEQKSFGYTEDEYMQRLNYIASALVAWGAVTAVQRQVVATKERPRVGKAVSIMLTVPEELVREWLVM
eukprot:jgi/Chrzof1/3469/Cz12g26210.t1